MNVKERRERKAKKHENFLARLKAQDERIRGVAPEQKVEEKVETEQAKVPEVQEAVFEFSTQAVVEAPETTAPEQMDESISGGDEEPTEDAGSVEEPAQDEVSEEELEAPVLEGKKKKGRKKSK